MSNDDKDADLDFSRWVNRAKKKRGKPINGYQEPFRPELLIRRPSCAACVLIESPAHMTVRPCAKHMEILRPRKAPVRENR